MDAELRSRLGRLLTYDPSTGVIRWATARGRAAAGDRAGTLDRDGYVVIGIDGRSHFAHRIAWALHYGETPPERVDHKNGNCADNRIDNLRAASPKTNAENQRRAHRTNKSGYMGVHWSCPAKKWVAKISINNRSVHIGVFDDPKAAHEAYVASKRAMHAGCVM